MKNLNSRSLKIKSKYYSKKRIELERLFKFCEKSKQAVPRLDLENPHKWFRDIEDALYFESKFNDLGTELVYSLVRKECK